MASNSILIPEHKLTRFVVDVLGAVGVPANDATIVADCLRTANLSGVGVNSVRSIKRVFEWQN